PYTRSSWRCEQDKRLSRQVRQRLIRIDLRAPLPQDRLKVVDGPVVCIERIRLRWRECGGLTLGGGDEAEIAEIGWGEGRDHPGDPIHGGGNRRREEEPATERGRSRGCKKPGG